MTTAFDTARAIGDAVLYHPRTPDFGALMPPAFASPRAGDFADCRVECLLEPRSHAVLHVRLRFLQSQECVVCRRRDDGGYEPVTSLTVDGTEYTSWNGAVEREIDAVLPLAELTGQRTCVPFVVGGAERTEILGQTGKLVRRSWSVTGELRLSAQVLGGRNGIRLRADVVNTTEWYEPDSPREEALRHAMLAVHVVLAVNAGRFVSLTEPPPWARTAAEQCRSHRLWPVLLGDNDAAVLAAPVALYDHPTLVPESEERIQYLRRGIPEDTWWDAGAVSPETDEVVVAGVAVSAGSRVRLRDGLIGTVQAVLSDEEGYLHLEIRVGDRYRYTTPDEIEPLPP
ncbi:hypothetical protein GCM10017786_36490 [Amycolatopsis deserti]|uniref:Uncharacterized protein n=1 Tax=Amycolatopsis deserti TaxID=185696 RepID=A0ABQ3J457_9PSEU|nr:hypothetical protein [Amycolatopsis deserti]GHF00364.1 hypothetical protein GCM10017786_36490 [Amycolatopsis deserti]